MRIGIAFDLAPTDPALRLEGPDDRFEEFDKPETVEAIAEVIRGEGHEVVLLGDGREFLTRVLADPPDFVFNIAEGEGVGRSRESRVPAVLEMLGIPYSGSDPLTLAASLDKDIAKTLVRDSNDVRMPPGWILPGDFSIGEDRLRKLYKDSGLSRCWETPSVPYPAILKPVFEGSSKGIRGRGIATDVEEAVSIYRDLTRDYQQPILIEQFIDGDEVTVGLVGNSEFDRRRSSLNIHGRDIFDEIHTPQVLGVMRIQPKDHETPFVYSLDVKRDWKNRVAYETPAQLPEQVVASLVKSSLGVFQALECRDLARIDFRVRDGVPYFIEANPLPGLAPGTSDLVILARGYGIEYPDLIRKILHAALTRVNLL